MHFRGEFYIHVVNGHAGEAAPLLARIALNVGHDAVAYPFAFEDLRLVGDFERRHGMQGLNEFYALECARSAILKNVPRWDSEHVERLKEVAQSPLPRSLSERYPI